MKNIKVLILSFFFSGSFLVQGQGVLTEADINRFIDTYEPMSKELEKLGDDWEGDNYMTSMGALKANSEVMSILNKYGWDEGLVNQWTAIAMGYSLVKMDEQLEALPEAQREQYKAVLTAKQMSTAITEDDKNLIRGRLADLDRLFDQ